MFYQVSKVSNETFCRKLNKGGMVTDFSGTSMLSNKFVVIERASTDNLGVLLGCVPNVTHVATDGKKWKKSEWNDIEVVSFHYWTRLDALIILVRSNVKNG